MRLVKKFIRKIFNIYIFFIGSIKILKNYKIIKNSKKFLFIIMGALIILYFLQIC